MTTNLSPELIAVIRQAAEEAAEDASRKVIHETLTALGISKDAPLEVQKDMSFLRDWRMASDEVRKKSIMTIVGILVTGLCGVIWLGIKGYVLR